LQFERDIPVHMVKYHVKPAGNIVGYRMRILTFRHYCPANACRDDGN
jgi:hypothetical protein